MMCHIQSEFSNIKMFIKCYLPKTEKAHSIFTNIIQSVTKFEFYKYAWSYQRTHKKYLMEAIIYT